MNSHEWAVGVLYDAVPPTTDSFHRPGRPVQLPCTCGFVAYDFSWRSAGGKLDKHIQQARKYEAAP